MASVKLVNGLHHPFHHHLQPHHHPHPLLLHYSNADIRPLIPSPAPSLTPSPSSKQSSSPSPNHLQLHHQTDDFSAMTLDYSLPNRSRAAERNHKRSAPSPNSAINNSQHSQVIKDGDGLTPHQNGYRMPLSPCPSPVGLDNNNSSETPTKKNKRKLSEPRRISESNQKETNDSETSLNPNHESSPSIIKVPRLSSPFSTSSTLSTSHSNGMGRNEPATNIGDISTPSQSHKRSKSSSSSRRKASKSPSRFQKDTKRAQSPPVPQSEASHSTPTSPTLNGFHPPHANFLHPFFQSIPPSTLPIIPPYYLPNHSYPPHPPTLPPQLALLPLHIQQSYLAAAAAASSTAPNLPQPSLKTAPAATSSSSSSPQPPSPSLTPTSKLAHPSLSRQVEKSESSHRAHNPRSSSPSPPSSSATSHSVILQAPQLPNHFQNKPLPPKPLNDDSQKSYSLQAQSSSRHYHQPNSLDNEDDDEDEQISNRAQSPEDLSIPGGSKMSRKHRKNYKNMTRERRVEANARERTRVHTISAAFEALRKAVPSYSHNQKLSKLAILRIAGSYIQSLARLADLDYTSVSEHIGQPLSFAECVDMCTNTIQTEGRARRRH